MGDLFGKLLVFEGELVDDADEGGDVGTELLEFLVLVGDRFFELDNGRPQASFDVWSGAAFLDPFVELVFQVGVALGQCVSGDVGFQGEGDASALRTAPEDRSNALPIALGLNSPELSRR